MFFKFYLVISHRTFAPLRNRGATYNSRCVFTLLGKSNPYADYSVYCNWSIIKACFKNHIFQPRLSGKKCSLKFQMFSTSKILQRIAQENKDQFNSVTNITSPSLCRPYPKGATFFASSTSFPKPNWLIWIDIPKQYQDHVNSCCILLRTALFMYNQQSSLSIQKVSRYNLLDLKFGIVFALSSTTEDTKDEITERFLGFFRNSRNDLTRSRIRNIQNPTSSTLSFQKKLLLLP